MTAKDIKNFITLVGDEADICLWCDNAINLYGKHRNSHIILDEQNELIYYIANGGNTIDDHFIDENGNAGVKPCEFIVTHTENVQYCRAKLTYKDAKSVLDQLKAKGLIDESKYTEISNDGIVFGRREHATRDNKINNEDIVTL